MKRLGILLGLVLVPALSQASISSVTVNNTRDFEDAQGYTRAEITIRGQVARADGTVGQYSVPAEIIFPEHRRGNGVGVVDWLNSAFYHFFPANTESGTAEFTRLTTGSYLFDEGYTYLTIQWNKKVTTIFGPTKPAGDGHNHLLYGSIESSADAWEILKDAARLLKDPTYYPGNSAPASVATVLSSGYSQGGAAQLEFITQGLDPGKVYDGHLVQMIGLVCLKRRDDDPVHFGFFEDCAPLPTSGDHAPVMMLVSESDMTVYSQLGFGKSAFFTRNSANPKWRQYELAGVAHMPKPIFDLQSLSPNQSSADPSPAFRAAYKNLRRWTHGRIRQAPPESRVFEGGVDANAVFTPRMDSDGHFAGGMRLPHVQSSVNGRVAGAPLGLQEPLNDAGRNPFHPFVLLGGTFTRFTDEYLLGRYASRHEYLQLVKRAADDLAAKAYITKKDRKALIRAALVEPLPARDECDDPTDDDGND
jgi:hypothetical protein